MDIIGFWKNRFARKAWLEVDADTYQDAFTQLGGSVITHPHIIRAVSEIVDIPLTYTALYEEGALVAAIPLWGNSIAGSKPVLKKCGKNRILDTGNPEFILPVARNWRGRIPFTGDFISGLNSCQAENLKPSKAGSISLARSYTSGVDKFSKKFKYNRRRERRLLEERGGQVLPVSSMSVSTFCETYFRLFEARWGFGIKGAENLEAFLSRIHAHLSGHYVTMDGKAIAIQLLLTTESPEWVSVEYINGGVDPSYNEYGPGSVLSYVNTSTMEEAARQAGKDLRFSFGKSDREYKDIWCHRSPVYRL